LFAAVAMLLDMERELALPGEPLQRSADADAVAVWGDLQPSADGTARGRRDVGMGLLCIAVGLHPAWQRWLAAAGSEQAGHGQYEQGIGRSVAKWIDHRCIPWW